MSAGTIGACWNCDGVAIETSEYQDDGRIFCSLDCLNQATAREQLNDAIQEVAKAYHVDSYGLLYAINMQLEADISDSEPSND